MSLFVHILINNIFPIFLAIGAGFGLARFTDIDPGALSKAVLYIFAPCLVYTLLTNIEIQAGEVARIVITALVGILASCALGWLCGRLLGLDRITATALMLVLMFTNGGNYGLALNQLAFGEEALARAAIYFVTNTISVFTLGLYLASSGRLTTRQALKSLFAMPPIYAVIAALLTVGFRFDLPDPITIPIALLGDASIPVMLVLLGVQMARASRLTNIRLVGLASGLRLLFGPLVAFGMVTLLHLQGPARQATVIEASMPTAVIVTAVATEFDVVPAFATSVVVLSTLLSPVTLTFLIALLR